ncbi:hypothetical protein ACU8MW_08110 [Rhizobium leguminosarum]
MNCLTTLACTILVLNTPAIAAIASAEDTDYVVVSAKVNPVQHPKGPGELLGDCARNAACTAVVKAGAAYIGVPPVAVSAALAVVGGSKPDDSEEGRFTISLSAAYVYCRSQIHMISVVPADGKRASVFSAASNEHGMSFYTWTPKRPVGGGRSWVDADVTVYGVKEGLAKQAQAEKKCSPWGRTIEDCRGNGTGDRPECKSVND